MSEAIVYFVLHDCTVMDLVSLLVREVYECVLFHLTSVKVSYESVCTIDSPRTCHSLSADLFVTKLVCTLYVYIV